MVVGSQHLDEISEENNPNHRKKDSTVSESGWHYLDSSVQLNSEEFHQEVMSSILGSNWPKVPFDEPHPWPSQDSNWDVIMSHASFFSQGDVTDYPADADVEHSEVLKRMSESTLKEHYGRNRSQESEADSLDLQDDKDEKGNLLHQGLFDS